MNKTQKQFNSGAGKIILRRTAGGSQQEEAGPATGDVRKQRKADKMRCFYVKNPIGLLS